MSYVMDRPLTKDGMGSLCCAPHINEPNDYHKLNGASRWAKLKYAAYMFLRYGVWP